jgi:hypothetical protein
VRTQVEGESFESPIRTANISHRSSLNRARSCSELQSAQMRSIWIEDVTYLGNGESVQADDGEEEGISRLDWLERCLARKGLPLAESSQVVSSM